LTRSDEFTDDSARSIDNIRPAVFVGFAGDTPKSLSALGAFDFMLHS
jgi:hypothetical protein